MNLLRGNIESSLRDFTQRVESWQSTNFCDSKNQSARSANPCKSFCYFWLSPKVESSLLLNPNLLIAQSKKIVGDSRIAKMDSSLRTSCYAQNDESFLDCHDLPLSNCAIANSFHNLPQRLNRAF